VCWFTTCLLRQGGGPVLSINAYKETGNKFGFHAPGGILRCRLVNRYKRLQFQIASHVAQRCGAGGVVGWTLVRGPSVTLPLLSWKSPYSIGSCLGTPGGFRLFTNQACQLIRLHECPPEFVQRPKTNGGGGPPHR
jgi:hypothetical protein